jgi:hypothetical protein
MTQPPGQLQLTPHGYPALERLDDRLCRMAVAVEGRMGGGGRLRKEKLGSIFPDPVNLLVRLRVGAVRG